MEGAGGRGRFQILRMLLPLMACTTSMYTMRYNMSFLTKMPAFECWEAFPGSLESLEVGLEKEVKNPLSATPAKSVAAAGDDISDATSGQKQQSSTIAQTPAQPPAQLQGNGRWIQCKQKQACGLEDPSHYRIDRENSTVKDNWITQLNLECDNGEKTPKIGFTWFFGFLIACGITPAISDRIGRKTATILVVSIGFVFTLMTYSLMNPTLFAMFHKEGTRYESVSNEGF